MENKTRILIVEDDMIIGANILLQLTNLGYEVTGLESRGEEAVLHANRNIPDIILMDINLKGAIDGIETAKAIQKTKIIPIIYLTANTDEATFSRAKSTYPEAFIAKPFNKLDLQRTLALVVDRLKDKIEVNKNKGTALSMMNDRIFIRHKGRMIKLLLDQVLYIEADRNYSKIVTANKEYIITSTLKTMEKGLKNDCFVRVHRSYVVNIGKLDAVADGYLEINGKTIPVSKTHKEFLLGHIHMV